MLRVPTSLLPGLLLLVIASACSERDGSARDGGAPTPSPSASAAPSPSPSPSPNLPPCPTRAPEGQRARAAEITDDAQRLSGPEAAGRIGDLRLDNGLITVVIEGAGRGRLWVPYGGSIIDAAPARGEDWFFSAATLAGFVRTLRPESVRVMADGSDGCPAVVRVRGRDAGIPVIDAGAGGLLRSSQVEIETDYILAPGARHLEVVTRLRDASERGTPRDVAVGDLLAMGDALTVWAPGVGAGDDALREAEQLRWVAAVRDGVAAYAWVVPERGFNVPISEGELQVALAGNVRVAASSDGPAVYRRYLVVGGGDLESLRVEASALLGEAAGAPVTLRVDAGEAPVAGARVEVLRDGRPVTFVVTGTRGEASVALPPGRYRLEATAPGHGRTAGSGADLEGARGPRP